MNLASWIILCLLLAVGAIVAWASLSWSENQEEMNEETL
jgi:hypothetical protein